MAVTQKTLLLNGESMGANIASDIFDLGQYSCGSIELHSASGTHVGTVQIAGTNSSGRTPIDIELLTASAVSGSALDELIEFNVKCQYIQVKYTRSSGTGTLDAIVHVKRER